MINQNQLDQLAVNAIRVYSMDAIQKANSGHPGTPLGAAPIAYELFARHLKHNPANPQWINRDRFILSAGHASMLLYSLNYIFGYGLTADDLANFRQLNSRTPGHPEIEATPGVDMSTGPLGQGFATAIGFAMAEAHLAAKYNRDDKNIIDHYTYVLCGDGCLQEGVSAEASSLAGTQKLDKLIAIYDRNQITIEGDTDLAFTEDVAARYRAYNWQVLEVEDANDMQAVGKAIEEAKANKEQPSLIIVNSQIGYGTELVGSAKTHGSPLGEENVKLAKEKMGWPAELALFEKPAELEEGMKAIQEALAEQEKQWNEQFKAWKEAYPELAEDWEDRFNPDIAKLWEDERFWTAPEKAEATRASSGKVLNLLAKELPQIMGGSADLAPSNKSWLDGEKVFSPADRSGRNIHFGVREFAMACAMNGLNLHGGVIGYCATFFVFSDYMRSAMRLSALMNIPAFYILSHDSIGVGEDGPTHEPIEHLDSLRAMPELLVFRPADFRECSAAWLYALESKRPTAFVLSRQNLPQLEASGPQAKNGAYVVRDKGDIQILLLGSGSEVHLLLEVQDKLDAKGIGSRVVSVPCMELFLEQDQAAKDEILPPEITARFAVEAGRGQSWYQLVGLKGKVHGIDSFGLSAPGDELFKHFGFDAETLTREAETLL